MATAESKILEEIDDNFLVCTVCSERYRNAKILPCLHSFCEQCIHKLVQKSGGKNIPCPVCRRVHDLPEGASSVQSNVFLNELVVLLGKRDKKTNEVHKCEGCQRDPMTTHCIDCAIGLCDICISTHKRLPSTKSHNLMSRQTFEAAKSVDIATVQPHVYCGSHPGNQLKFYCDTCDVPICLECTALNHKITEHDYRYLKDTASQYAADLTKVTDMLAEKEKEARDSKENVQRMTELLENRFSEQEHKLNVHIERVVAEITAKIRKNGEELLHEMNKIFSERKQNLHTQMKELEIAENDMKHAHDFATHLMNYGNAAQLMSAKKGMTSQIDELLKLKTKQHPAEHDYMEFQSYDDFCETKTLGEILHNKYILEMKDVSTYHRIGDDVSITMATTGGNVVDCVTLKQKIQSEMLTPPNTTEEVEVTDNKDGTCSLTYRAKVKGVHELTVLVNNKSVQGSPVKINVIPKKGLMGKYGRKGSGVSRFYYPESVLITSEGNVLVCDRGNNRLQLLTFDGKHKRMIQFTGFNKSFCPCFAAESQDGDYFITDVTTDTDGYVYVSDTGNNRIQKYDCHGQFVCRINSPGDGLSGPRGICVTNDKPFGKVVVADYNNHYIKIFAQ
ncbi:tripartite motif-containing protein 2-like [Saccoglossus kowalevskii]|uniref:Tripartite motif-containing protein 2-like n=1 Tax=Saccoglossus kowalevskii TaxID=10224 RepID=A0ABM0M510_SACKO|nr:PREDICTED: tripartite motif-containing protein 2-like [Saccoglossus kowalevskii]